MKESYMRKVAATMAFSAILCSFAPASAQSLWVDGGGKGWSMFADRKAHDVGDILTIVISETTTTSMTKNGSNSKSGKTDVSAGIGIFSFLKAASAGASDSFTAKGSSADTNKVSGNITVTVTEVLPNGNMMVEGVQSIWQGKNEHKITLTGMIRSDDITYANTIPSTKVADAVVRFDGRGPLNAKQRQGILTQILNFLF